ncbi:MAG: PAS domain S-box protein [Phormidesmis sp.]
MNSFPTADSTASFENNPPSMPSKMPSKMPSAIPSAIAPSSYPTLPFFELAADIMCILDAQGRCCQVNPAFTQTLGYTSTDMSGQALAAIAHPEDREHHLAAISTLLTATSATNTSSSNSSFTYRYQHQSGGYRWLDWRISAVKAPEPRAPESGPERLYCIARDVTDQLADSSQRKADIEAKYSNLQQIERQNRSDAQQAKAEARMYADAVQNMQVGLYIWQLEAPQPKGPHTEPTLKLVGANPAAKEFTGVDAAAFIGETIEVVFPALKGTDIPAAYIEVVKSQEQRNLGEVSYGDDRVKPSTFEVKAFPLNDQCVGVAFENITRRKQHETAHRENEEQLRIIFDQASVGMARLSLDGRWIQVNQQLCELLGYSRSALIGASFSAVTHPDDIEISQLARQRLLGDSLEDLQETFEKRYTTSEGSTLWVTVTISAVRDSANQPRYFIATIQDITAQKQATQTLQRQKDDLITVNMMLTETMSRLEERNQELDQFAYVTSHDLKAPLRAIANLATWIEEDLEGELPEENKAQFELLKSRVKRMEGLINGLLEYSRVDRTHQSHERVDVADLIDEVVDSISPPAGFKIELDPNLPVLESKKVPLRQVFSNLITNAVKHHDQPDGTIRISARPVDSFYEFTVADDGPGIEPAYHDKIFVIFQTLQSRDDFESTGIGLSLVQKIVRSEGGTISLNSTLGAGAAFRFTWPKAPHQGIQFT